jgi:hypothetical protein
MKRFVSGRVCLIGEHNDWAAEICKENVEFQAIITATSKVQTHFNNMAEIQCLCINPPLCFGLDNSQPIIKQCNVVSSDSISAIFTSTQYFKSLIFIPKFPAACSQI